MERIRRGTNPNYLFLPYELQEFRVSDLFLVPKHFMTPSIVEERRPLSVNARRGGWVGSNIVLGNLPRDAQIHIVESGVVASASDVRDRWRQFLFLREQRLDSRGWLADVLACVRDVDREVFTLADVYGFEQRLSDLHPKNQHVRPKIRQQLQVLRDPGIVEFQGKGSYRIKN